MFEPNEMVNGYDPDDPPQGGRWCSECSSWDDDCSCDTDAPVIKTQYNCPPIPSRDFDWAAWIDGREQGPYGHGCTEAEAIENLKEALEQ